MVLHEKSRLHNGPIVRIGLYRIDCFWTMVQTRLFMVIWTKKKHIRTMVQTGPFFWSLTFKISVFDSSFDWLQNNLAKCEVLSDICLMLKFFRLQRSKWGKFWLLLDFCVYFIDLCRMPFNCMICNCKTRRIRLTEKGSSFDLGTLDMVQTWLLWSNVQRSCLQKWTSLDQEQGYWNGPGSV
jgi:hypothetical protein